MEIKIKSELLKNIGKVYEQSKGCKLDSSIFDRLDRELEELSAYFKTTKRQAFLIAIVFAASYKQNTVEMNDLIEYFDCNPIELLEYSEEIITLYSKGVLMQQPFAITNDYLHRFTSREFQLNEKVAYAILMNKAMPITDQTCFTDIIEVLEKLYGFGEQRNEEKISTNELFGRTAEIISSNLHFPLIKKVNDFKFKAPDSYFYLYLIWKTVSGNDSIDLSRASEGIFDKPSEKIRYVRNILSGENILVKNNLTEIDEAPFFNDSKIKLTDLSQTILEECDLKLFLHKKKRKKNIINPSDIHTRQLIFNENEMKQLALFKNLMHEPTFSETQNRLKSKGLPKGITVLLHGAPGTGKTETVMQFAKESGREIMKVDISQSKSCWFGESEKIIKKIFTEYKSFAKECKLTPVLLFNEADAIISKRKENGVSAVAQTENAMQNILLEELENFEGILIATTNLAGNFDKAFERRFLFKIEFRRPDLSAKTKIWNNKLPGLSYSECERLAAQFDFTGGQIDNIVRKQEINEIMHGGKIDFAQIIEFCTEETIGHEPVKVGFCKNLNT